MKSRGGCCSRWLERQMKPSDGEPGNIRPEDVEDVDKKNAIIKKQMLLRKETCLRNHVI